MDFRVKSCYSYGAMRCNGFLLFNLLMLLSSVAPASAIGNDSGSLLQSKGAIVWDQLIANVNGEAITQSELQDKVKEVRSRLQGKLNALPIQSTLAARALSFLINARLELQETQEAGISVDQSTVILAAREIARRDRLSFEAFEAAVRDQGISLEDYMIGLRNQIAVERLKEYLFGDVDVSDEEVDLVFRFQKQNHLSVTREYSISEIFIANYPDLQLSLDGAAANSGYEAVEQARAKTAKIQNRIKQGESFMSLAVSDSDESHALQGGELGWRKLEQLPWQFIRELPTMKVGDVVGPFESVEGFHIYRLNEVRGAVIEANSSDSVTSRKAEIRRAIQRLKLEKEARIWLLELRERARIEILHPQLTGFSSL